MVFIEEKRSILPPFIKSQAFNPDGSIYYEYDIQGQGKERFIGIHYISAWDLNCEYQYTPGYVVESGVNKIRLATNFEYYCDIENPADAAINYDVKGLPFDFVPVYIDKDLIFTSPNGAITTFDEGKVYVMPYCFVDLIFRKLHQAQFSLKVSRTAFVISLAAAPFTGLG